MGRPDCAGAGGTRVGLRTSSVFLTTPDAGAALVLFERIERAEYRLVSGSSHDEAEIASGRSCGQDSLNRRAGIAKGAVGIALAIGDDVVQRRFAQLEIDDLLPEIAKKFSALGHGFATPPIKLRHWRTDP